MAGSATAARARPERRRDLVEAVWDLFASTEIAVALVLALAAASLAGAIVDAASAAPSRIVQELSGRWWWPIYCGLEIHDLFRSWWFLLLLVALALAAVASGAERLPRIARAAAGHGARLAGEAERALRGAEPIPAGPDPAATAARVAAAFRARGFEPEMVDERKIRTVYAERGRHARLGEWLVWPSLLAIGVAGIAGAVLGWQGTVEVQEGAAFDAVAVATAGGEVGRRSLHFGLRVDRLEARPARASVTLLDGAGRATRREAIGEGRPLREAGIEIDVAGLREVPDGSRAVLAVVDRSSGARREVIVGPGEPIQLGGIAYTVERYAPGSGDLGPAVQVTRVEGDQTTTFWVFERRPDLDALSRPDRYAFEFKGLRGSQAAELRVAHRPAAPALAAACLLLAIGLAWTLSATHRRLWARVEPGAIVLAGAADRHGERFAGAVAGLRAELASAPEGKG